MRVGYPVPWTPKYYFNLKIIIAIYYIILNVIYSRVSLLTALRIWVSLPDELSQEPGPCARLPPPHRQHVARTQETRESATCSLGLCNCSLERVSGGRMLQVYHHNTDAAQPRDEVEVTHWMTSHLSLILFRSWIRLTKTGNYFWPQIKILLHTLTASKC